MNISTTPNKEIVRRICVMNDASFCYLLVEYSSATIKLYANIPDNLILKANEELLSWCGMPFKIYNDNSETLLINNIMNKGEKILPIAMYKQHISQT